MKLIKKYSQFLLSMAVSLTVSNSAMSQCVTPVITSISNDGPACAGGTIHLTASGTIGGLSSSYIRMAGIGANEGNEAFNQVFSYGDRSGSITRISNATFDAIFASASTDASRAALLKAQYDVLMFTWASPYDSHITWGLISEYLNLGGSVFVDGDYNNVNDFSPTITGYVNNSSDGCSYILVSPAPFPALVANGVNGCFVNNHISLSTWPSWMHAYIMGSDNTTTMAIAGIYPSGNHGRLIMQGPDQDFHAYRGASSYPWGGGTAGNQYQICLNQIDFLSANQGGFTWSGPAGFTSNETNPILTSVTTSMAGVYTATLTNTTGGGCYAVATTTVSVTTPPSAGTISGNNSVFEGYTTALSETVSGGTWSSSNTSVATVNSSGVVTGVAAGDATITYTVGTGCTSDAVYGVHVITCGANAVLTFNFTNTTQSWTVPANVNSVDVTVVGASGGSGYFDASYGTHPGRGGKVTATLAVTPGQVLNLFVGGQGDNATGSSAHSHGGFNGGGDGGEYGYYSSGGGGASDIRIGGTASSDRVIVAGGGGGNGYVYYSGQNGGDGGDLTGGTGGAISGSGSGATGGSQIAGGTAGNYYGYGGNYQGTNGTADNGGTGAYYYGGGGGGGYYGGGGGGYGGDGGGGSSYAGAIASSVTYTQGTNTGGGQIVISFPQSNVVIGTQPSSTTVCAGTTASFNVSASISIAPGTLNYQWQVNSGSGWNDISGANASTYSFTAATTDNGNQYRCVVSSVCSQVTNSDAATLTIATISASATVTNVSCNSTNSGNHSDGSITTAVSGATTYTYSWSGGLSGASPTGLTTGTYSVTVTGDNGCVATASATVGEPTAISYTSVTATDISCNNSNGGTHNDGTATVNGATGGTGTLTYAWSNGATANPATGLTVGSYSATITDGNGCSQGTSSATVGQPTAISYTSVTATGISCNNSNDGTHNNGTATVNGATGGTGTLSYAWSNGATTNPATGLTGPATYSVTITDGNSCTTTGSASVGQPTLLTVSWPTSVGAGAGPQYDASNAGSCGSHYFVLYGYDASLSANASGGTGTITLHWNTGATGSTLTVPTTGTAPTAPYTVYASDANGCSTATICASDIDVRCSTPGNSTKTQMCRNGHTICVDDNAVASQLASGATLGPCGSWKSSKQEAEVSDVKVYPNPNDGTFSVVIPSAQKTADVVISDVTGRVMQTRSIADNNGEPVQFNLGNVPTGMYLVKVNAGEYSTVVKVTVR